MPLGPGVKYRFRTNPDGSKVRLAFRGKKVLEAKPLKQILADNIRKRRSKRP